MTKIKYICKYCGSSNLLFDAIACWNEEKQEFYIYDHYDSVDCLTCGLETKVTEKKVNE